MKKRLAMVLSLSGVLVAGSAAAIVNTQVLNEGAGNTSTASQDDDSTSTSSTIATGVTDSTSTTIPTSTSIATGATVVGSPGTSLDVDEDDDATSSTIDDDETSSSTVDTSGSTGASVPTSGPTQAVYQVGSAGTVTLDTAGDVLTIVSVTPNPGWFVDKAENEGPLAIEVEFQSNGTELEFTANLLFGVVGTHVEVDSSGSGSPSTSVVGTAPSSSIDDHGGGDDGGSGSDSSGSGSSGSGSDHSGSGSGGHDDD